MYMISPSQVRAARGLLSWTQQDLADAANVGVSSIKIFEKAEEKTDNKLKIPRADLINQLRDTLEGSGIQFLEGDGVKRRCETTRVYKGSDAGDKFFDEMLKAATENDDSILAFFKSQDDLTKYSGEPRRTNLERLNKLHEVVDIKCLVAQPNALFIPTPQFEIRPVPKCAISQISFFVYGDKFAWLDMNAYLDMTIIAIHESTMTLDLTKVFMNYWDHAPVFQAAGSRSERSSELRISV